MYTNTHCVFANGFDSQEFPRFTHKKYTEYINVTWDLHLLSIVINKCGAVC